MQTTIKVLISAVTIVAIAELSKRDLPMAALLASIPLTSVLAMLWMHQDGTTSKEMADFSLDVFWLVIPSLLLFLVLPYLLNKGYSFPISLLGGIGVTMIGYAVVLYLQKNGIILPGTA